jgi:hypothetical protein
LSVQSIDAHLARYNRRAEWTAANAELALQITSAAQRLTPEAAGPRPLAIRLGWPACAAPLALTVIGPLDIFPT